MVQIKPAGSPKFALFWVDVKPIAVKWAKGVGIFAVTSGVAALGDPAFQAAVLNNFGTVAASVVGTLLAFAIGSQWVKDNTKG